MTNMSQTNKMLAPGLLTHATRYLFFTGKGGVGKTSLSTALATAVGVLIAVPVMLLVVKVANSTKDWYEAGALGAVEREAQV